MTFLEEIYTLSKLGDTESATLKIFDFIDELLLDNSFDLCDTILSEIDVDQLDTKLMRSFLCITFAAKDKLPSRAALFQRIENKIFTLRGSEKTERIVGKLK